MHALYFTELAEAFDAAGVGSHEAALFRRLRREHANLRAALAWSRARPAEALTALRLAVALHGFWMANGYFREGRHWLESVLTCAVPSAAGALRARALEAAGGMAIMLGDLEHGRAQIEQAIELACRAAPAAARGARLTNLSFVAHLHEHDDAKANDLLEQVMAIGRAIDDKNTMAASLLFRGGLAIDAHDYGPAEDLCAEALVLYGAVGTTFGIADALSFLGEIARLQHDYGRACSRYRESLAGWQALETYAWKGVGTAWRAWRTSVRRNGRSQLRRSSWGRRRRSGRRWAPTYPPQRRMRRRPGLARCTRSRTRQP